QNYVAGATVTFTAPATGPSGTFANGTTTYTTTSGLTGLATATTFTSNNNIGQMSIAISASKNGVTVNTSMVLTIGRVKTTTAVTFDPSGSSVYGQPLTAYATVTAQNGTLIPAAPVTFTRGGS